jgi:hypothetical protein
MNPIKIAALALVVAGVLGLVYGGFSSDLRRAEHGSPSGQRSINILPDFFAPGEIPASRFSSMPWAAC